MRMKLLIASFAVGAALALGGCASTAQFIADAAQSLSSSSPSQVTTLAEAEQAAKIATDAVDLYVNNGNPDRGTLIEIKSLSDGLHTALTDLEQANAQGKSLTYSSFNAALDAFNAYATSKGISH